jgi:lipopolysaccharide export system protein LptA
MTLRAGVFVVVALGCSGMAPAAQVSSVIEGVSLKADNLERLSDELFRATGNVEVSGNGFRVRADSVDLARLRDAGGSRVEFGAQGNVVLTLGSERLVLESLHFNPNAGTGFFQLPRGKR